MEEELQRILDQSGSGHSLSSTEEVLFCFKKKVFLSVLPGNVGSNTIPLRMWVGVQEPKSADLFAW